MTEPYVPNMAPGQVQPPSREIYDLMGEENIYKMLFDFYQKLGKSTINQMFPLNHLEEASRKSADFFIGLLGGPPYYHQRHGAPQMRGRHMPFEIGYTERQVWLDCFEEILGNAEQYNFPEQHLEGFHQFLIRFSEWMVNKNDLN